ncbi:MAG: sigma factor-like helix-turn-helix DNA-binding protein [Patescibacteria group bacterium]
MSEQVYPTTPYPKQLSVAESLASERAIGIDPSNLNLEGIHEGEIRGKRTDNQRENDMYLKTMLGLEQLPDQVITSHQAEVYGRRIILGDKAAVDEYLLHRLHQIMSVARQRFERQSPAVNLTLEDTFQNTYIETKRLLSNYDGKKRLKNGKKISFQQYVSINFFKYVTPRQREEMQALPLSGTELQEEYKGRHANPNTVAVTGVENIDDLGYELQGTGTYEVIEEVAQDMAVEDIGSVQSRMTNKTQAAVIALRYGINQQHPMTGSEAADHTGLSEGQVRTIEYNGLKSMAGFPELRGSFDEVGQNDYLQQQRPPSQRQIALNRQRLDDLLEKHGRGRDGHGFAEDGGYYNRFSKTPELDSQIDSLSRFLKIWETEVAS